MTRPRNWGPPLLVLVLLALSAPGCLRLSAPDEFACGADSDCAPNEKCPFLQSTCKPKDWCLDNSHCDELQACRAGHCVAAQCSSGNVTACNGYRCENGACLTSCLVDSTCQPGFVCNDQFQCVALGNLSDGKACKQWTECASRNCCGPNGQTTCRERCAAVGETCGTGEDCLSGYCCANAAPTLSCSATPCRNLFCVVESDCGEGWCVAGNCEYELLHRPERFRAQDLYGYG
jgi:hypothetical protein